MLFIPADTRVETLDDLDYDSYQRLFIPADTRGEMNGFPNYGAASALFIPANAQVETPPASHQKW